MAKKVKIFGTTIVLTLLAGTAGWALYGLINQAIKDLLKLIGIINIYAQLSSTLLVIFLIFVLFGFGFKKTINKIIN